MNDPQKTDAVARWRSSRHPFQNQRIGETPDGFYTFGPDPLPNPVALFHSMQQQGGDTIDEILSMAQSRFLTPTIVAPDGVTFGSLGIVRPRALKRVGQLSIFTNQ
jgi:hypothetical protein